MKIALTADWHFRGKDLDAAALQLRGLIAACREHGVRDVCVAGDIFDAANIHDSNATTGRIVSAILPLIAQSDLNWMMIPGNHDVRGVGQSDALEVFGALDNVMVVRRHGWAEIGNGVHAYCMPWDWSGASADDLLATMPGCPEQPAKTLLLAHVQVVGAKLNRFRTMEAGGTWCVSRETLDRAGFDRICLGDFHARQELVAGRGGYVGALRQLSFGEEGNPSGFEIWDTEKNAVQYVPLPGAPEYFTREISDVGDLDAFLHSRKTGANYKVRFTDCFAPDRARIADIEAAGIIVEQVVEATERTSRAEAIPEGIIDDPIALLRLWASAQSPPVEGGDLQALIDLHNEHSARGNRFAADTAGEAHAPAVPSAPEPACAVATTDNEEWLF